ncbi:LytR family transcriptional regulator, partial [Rhodococcus hoagii]|nr:LytR family transcriptional regulator [Prescottella equi]
MGDEHNPGHAAPEGRAPWERPIADPDYREATGHRRRRDGESGRRALDDDPSEQLSVAELMQKMGRTAPVASGGRRARPDEAEDVDEIDEAPGIAEPEAQSPPGFDAEATEIIPAVTDAPPADSWSSHAPEPEEPTGSSSRHDG